MYSAILFIVIPVVCGANTLHHSDQQPPDAIGAMSSGYGEATTTLQYCIIDNHTIARIDTGQQLDIIYITNRHIIATLSDKQNVVVVMKMDRELVCETQDMGVDIISMRSYVIFLLTITAMVMVTGYNFIIHLMYKKLRNLIGKLLMLYSFFLALHFTTAFLLVTANYTIAVGSAFVCYTIMIAFITLYVSSEAVATCILTHIAHSMHQSYKMRQISNEMNKRLHKRYIVYISSSAMISLFLLLTYDFATGNWRNAMLSNGHCVQLDQVIYDAMHLVFASSVINKALQIVMFTIYLYYWYKMRKFDQNVMTLHRKTNRNLFKIAVAMGATIGVSQLFMAFNKISGVDLMIAEQIGGILIFIQHCAIVVSFRWIKNIYKAICKKS